MNNEIYTIMQNIEVKQVILQGPPGTSKTHGAKEIIASVIKQKSPCENLENYKLNHSNYEKNFELKNEVYWDMVQFHPSYSYEDFVRGITVSTIPEGNVNAGDIKYDTVNKIFGQICELAGRDNNKDKIFFLIIDEINRADVATVFGELIYALEYRGENNKIATPYSVEGEGRDIYVPENLYIIGTMNTADKSVGTIDMAIRRRFLFVDQLPDADVINNCFNEHIDKEGEQSLDWNILLVRTMECFSLLKRIVENSIRGNYKAKDFMIGHTYFLPAKDDKVDKAKERIELKLKYQVLPMLREYAEDRIIEVANIKLKDDQNEIQLDNLKKYLQGDDSVLEDVIREIFTEMKDGQNNV